MNIKIKKPMLLFFPMDSLSHQLRCLQLADSIRDFTTCIFVTEKYLELIKSRGYEAAECQCLSAEMIIKKGQSRDSSWVSVKILEPIFERQFRLIEKINPDYVVNDYSFTAQLAAERAGKPCISLINGLFSKHLAVMRGVPPSHPAAKFAFLMPKILILFIENLIFKNLHLPYRYIRKNYRLSNWRRNFLEEFEGDLNFILDSEEFAPRLKSPENTLFLGTLYHTDTKIETQLLEKLDPLKKTILVNMGSGGQNERVQFLNDDFFSKYNVIAVGDKTESLSAKHIIKAGFLSLESVLPQVDLVLNQAGTGNIFQSLAHGIPMLCYPTFFEQEWNALRVHKLGYGLCLTGKEPLERMQNLIEVWSQKKMDMKFTVLRGSINVRATKERFRKSIKRFIS